MWIRSNWALEALDRTLWGNGFGSARGPVGKTDYGMMTLSHSVLPSEPTRSQRHTRRWSVDL